MSELETPDTAGVRVDDKHSHAVRPGEYGKLDGGAWWFIYPPGGKYSHISPAMQAITEHPDGTITVEGLITQPWTSTRVGGSVDPFGGKKGGTHVPHWGWTGRLIRGVWHQEKDAHAIEADHRASL